MPADLLAGCSGTEWNPKDPVALGTDYRCCSEGMWRDRMDPDGNRLGLLITQRSRVQIPPPPPSLTSTFGASPPLKRTAERGCRQSFVSGGPGLRSGPFAFGGIVEDEAGHGVGGLGVHAGNDVAVDVQGDGDGGVAQALADHLGRDARGQGRGGVAVADVVQPDRRQAGGAGQSPEPVSNEVGVDGEAVGSSEDQPRVPPGRPDLGAFLVLAGPCAPGGRPGWPSLGLVTACPSESWARTRGPRS
jgi:hypothetical protein